MLLPCSSRGMLEEESAKFHPYQLPSSLLQLNCIKLLSLHFYWSGTKQNAALFNPVHAEQTWSWKWK